jgi:phosphotriesterase-related protein
LEPTPKQTSQLVETVRGPVAVEELGPALLHEHIFIASPEGVLNHNHTWGEPWWDEELRVADAVTKLQEVRDIGIRTLVDPTAFGLSRNVRRIQRVNAQVDLHIVVCTGIYAFLEVPAYLKYRTAENLASIFTREIEVGIDDTGVKAAFLKCAIESYGVAGDIPLILDAVGLTHAATGVPVMVHTNGESQTGRLALEQLTARGVDPTRVVIAHAGDSADPDYLRHLADAGMMLGFDRFNTPFSTDEARVESIVALIADGYIDRIHLSHDAATFNDFMQHNPRFASEVMSYTHIHRNVLPKLREAGVTDAQIDEMLTANARRFLAG